MTLSSTEQIRTRYADASRSSLVTELVQRPLRKLEKDEILVEVLCVPLHGSFWLASHPLLLHPRHEELLRDGAFVFGNGGVGRVLALGSEVEGAQVGDIVAMFGHTPCRRKDCAACREKQRYVECRYGEATILGHGNGANDGTYARHAILPPCSWEVCFRKDEHPTAAAVRSFMFAFLVADVRNALSRHPETLGRRNVLLVGAGQAGRIAALLLRQAQPECRILVVEASAERADRVHLLAPDAIAVHVPRLEAIARLEDSGGLRVDDGVIDAIATAAREHFGGRGTDLIFDASSGNSAPLWSDSRLLGPDCHCIPFGFGSHRLVVDRELLQCSGLTFVMSRGVGDLANRREVVRLLRNRGDEVERWLLVDEMQRLASLEEAVDFIREQQEPPKPLHLIPTAYFTPTAD